MSGPDKWGPHGWKFIHYITLGYPSNPSTVTKKQYLDFFTTLQYVIPCSICGSNFIKHVKEYPLTDEILSDKQKFINWGILMHNLVNIQNNKKKYTDKEAFTEIIKNCTGDCPGYTNISLGNTIDKFSSNGNIIFFSSTNIIFMVIIFILVLIIIKYKK